jgi:ATP-binding cassette subfamily B protein
MVAHRISTVKKLDKIVLLDQGKLIGIGTHEELLATNAVYQEMVRLQTLETLVGETKHA